MNTYDFDADFQKLLLACLITHEDELAYALPCLKPSYFTSVEATLTAESAIDYRNQYGHLPTFVTLAQLVATADERLHGERDPESSVVAYAQELAEFDTSDWKYVGSQIAAFAREMEYRKAILAAVDHLKKGTEPTGGMSSLFDAARQMGENIEDRSLLLHMDIARTVGLLTNPQNGIPTGYALLDEIWKHGWQPGWLVVPLAPPERLKSTFCLNIALNLVSAPYSYDVLYFTCEISKELAWMRVACNAAGLSLAQANRAPEEFIAKAQGAMEKKIAGNLWFTDFPSKSATVGDIRSHAKLLIKQHNLKPKLIIIDYAETVRPTKRANDEPHYRQQANIYTEARALATELGCVVLMPDRCNQEAVNKIVPDMTAFQGAFEKAGIVDVALGLCATDEEYLANTLRVFTIINRHGPQYQHIRGKVYPELFRIELEEVIPYQSNSKPKPGADRHRTSKCI